MIKKYRKKPVVIEAVQWTGDNVQEVLNFSSDGSRWIMHEGGGTDLFIDTLEGQMKASRGDYIIKGVCGECYPCKPDIFEKTYEMVDND